MGLIWRVLNLKCPPPPKEMGYYFVSFSLERGREEHRSFVACFIYAEILLRALTGNQTLNLGVSGWCSNTLSYLAKAALFIFINYIYLP